MEKISFLLAKNMGKDFSCIEIWSNTDHVFQNYRLWNLLFRLTDSYVCHLNWSQKKIAIMSWVPISKTSQPAITRSKLTIETLEQGVGVKYVQG